MKDEEKINSIRENIIERKTEPYCVSYELFINKRNGLRLKGLEDGKYYYKDRREHDI